MSADAEDALGNVERVHRELLLRRSALIPVEAEACYDRALDKARAHQPRSWKLRECDELIPKMVGGEPVYGWFTERFDTADLQSLLRNCHERP